MDFGKRASHGNGCLPPDGCLPPEAVWNPCSLNAPFEHDVLFASQLLETHPAGLLVERGLSLAFSSAFELQTLDLAVSVDCALVVLNS
mmetsp:Transcript_82867/g.152076  ORF Transcript_82867/g.152076 Transcript_82867/m.152076 type:complete len:88 (-) Transcript_82867:469-732(-)